VASTASRSPTRLALCPDAVPIDKSPVDLEAEAGTVAEVQVTVALGGALADVAINDRFMRDAAQSL
jgi:hypothetical protein